MRSFLTLFVPVLFAVCAARFGLPSRLFCHLAYGRSHLDHLGDVWSNPAALERDRLSPFTLQKNAVIDPSWLSRILLAKTAEFGESRGLEGSAEMLLLLQFVLTFLFGLLLLLAYRRQCGSLKWSIGGLALLALVLAPPIPGPLRPELFGMVCFAAVLCLLSGPRLSWWALLSVPAIFALWVNWHASFMPGLVLPIVLLVGRILDVCLEAGSWNPLRARDDVRAWQLVFVVLLSLLATLANPWGPDLYWRMTSLTREYILADAPGWRPLDFSKWELHTFFLIGSLALLVLTQALLSRPFSGTQMVMIFTFAVLPLFLARLIVWWFPLLPWVLLSSRPRAEDEPLELRRGLLIVSGLFAVLLTCRLAFGAAPPPLGLTVARDVPWRVTKQLLEPADSNRVWLPALAERLRASYPDGRFQGTIYTTTSTGDFLLWALRGRWPVFAFSEIVYFGGDHWRDYTAVRQPEPDWWELLDRKGVNLIVIDRRADAALATVLATDPAWQVVEGEASPGMGLLVAIRKVP